MNNTTTIGRPFSTAPTPEFATLMAAIHAWVKSIERQAEADDATPVTWDEAADTLSAMMRVVRYADCTCECGGTTWNYPHTLTPSESGGWEATYRCTECARTYRAGYADNLSPGA